jgi:uncharacterized membrane protein
MTSAGKIDKTVACGACAKGHDAAEGTPLEALHPWLAKRFREEHPDAPEDTLLCEDCLDQLRNEHYAEMLRKEIGEVGDLEKAVVAALQKGGLLTGRKSGGPTEKPTFGQRLADRMAAVGGSWGFIIGFVIVLTIWMSVNSLLLGKHAFDPFPFILLNLALSMLSAIQGPVIMMSQNREEALDRKRAEMDYKINLKAELENRELLQTLDQIISLLLEVKHAQHGSGAAKPHGRRQDSTAQG